jgi:hypothetical protein
MDTMLASLPDDCTPNRLFMALFLRRLPADIRDQLVAHDLKDPAAMATVADRIYDARPQGCNMHMVQQQHAAGRRCRLHPATVIIAAGTVAAVKKIATTGCVFITPTLVPGPPAAARHVAGRETGQRPMAWATKCCRLTDTFLMEEDSGKSFLVDTEAAVSVVLFRGQPAAATAYLTGPDSTVIPAWGTVTLTLRFGGQQLSGLFVRAAVSKPILGVDFLARHKLLVDAAGCHVLSADTLKSLSLPSIPCHRSPFTASVGHITSSGAAGSVFSHYQ